MAIDPEPGGHKRQDQNDGTATRPVRMLIPPLTLHTIRIGGETSDIEARKLYRAQNSCSHLVRPGN